jgi:hypothetical protein
MTRNRALLLGGALAGPLFVVIFMVAGATRDSYDAARHPISSLALGPGGGVQVANFVLGGLLSLALALGLWPIRKAGAILVGIWGLGFLGAAVFTTDPVSGYPAGTPEIPAGTMDGTLHNLSALVGALALVAACFVMARGRRGWVVYSVLTAGLFVVTFGLASVGFGQAAGLVDVAGLLQRVAVIAAWTWLTALAIRTLRSGTTPPSGQVGV